MYTDFALSNAFTQMQGIKEIVLSYDIMCQYIVNQEQRFHDKQDFLIYPLPKIVPLIPKFHLSCHQEQCRYQYSFNHTKSVGWTDGEGIERFWSPHNQLSSSTSKMLPGFRLDTLNMHFSDWNSRKSRKLGTLHSLVVNVFDCSSYLSFRTVYSTTQSTRTIGDSRYSMGRPSKTNRS
jgi:hypothetical protein